MNDDFKRVFKCMPWEPDDVSEATVRQFADTEMTQPPLKKDEETKDEEAAFDAAFMSSDIPAGYTYFGQFVDHDLTFDQTALADAGTLAHGDAINHRTPVFDLDSVYQGKINDDHRFDFDERPPHFRNSNGKIIFPDLPKVGNLPRILDLPREGDGTAIIGDPRNDENALVAQIHLAFMLAHNEIMGRLKSGDPAANFTKARRILTWLYHWVIVNDFLPRIVRNDIFNLAFPNGKPFKNVSTPKVDFGVGISQIPAEFAFAAYRFGHSMVRNSYQTNNSAAAGRGDDQGFGHFTRIFDAHSCDDLRGGQPLTLRIVVQWDWFLQMKSSIDGLFPQKAMPINTTLSRALTQLEAHPDPDHVNNFLATRNILRGIRVGMPKASCVFKALQGFLGHLVGTNTPDTLKEFLGHGEIPEAKFPAVEFLDEQEKLVIESLWYYILREAREQGDGKLGVVGSSIVAFTFAQLLANTSNSYLNVNPGWTPNDEHPVLNGDENDDERDNRDGDNDKNKEKNLGWTLASIIRLSGLPINSPELSR